MPPDKFSSPLSTFSCIGLFPNTITNHYYCIITCKAMTKAIVKIHVLLWQKAELMFLPLKVCCEQLYSIRYSKNKSYQNVVFAWLFVCLFVWHCKEQWIDFYILVVFRMSGALISSFLLFSFFFFSYSLLSCCKIYSCLPGKTIPYPWEFLFTK